MTEPSTPPASVPQDAAPSPEPASPKRPWTILGRLSKAVREQNWFAVVLELGIVVLGVVIGFQVTAWGQARSDRAKEQVYLRQLATDLRQTEQDLTEADSASKATDRAAAKLLMAYYVPERPERDSVLAWFREGDRYYPIRPVTGTAEALVATGDLSLIQNESLRSDITAYLDAMRSMMRVHDATVAKWLEHYDRLHRLIDVSAVSIESLDAGVRDSLFRATGSAAPEAATHRDPFPLDVERLLTDRDTRYALYIANYTKGDLSVTRVNIRHLATALRERVEAELDR